RTRNDLVQTILLNKLSYRNTRDSCVGDQWNHVVAVPTQHQRLDIFHAHPGLFRDKRTVTRRIQNAGHSHHAFLREPARLIGHISHHIEWVAHHDDDTVRRVLHDLLRHTLYDPRVRLHKIV